VIIKVNEYINYLQLRAARSVLNLGVREIGSIIGVSRMTISKLENNKATLEHLKHGESRNNTLIWFFKKKNIIFPNNYTICNSSIINEDLKTHTLTRFQLRSARAIIGIDRKTFRDMIGVEKGILEYAESYNNQEYINPRDNDTNQRIKDKFSQYGIQFLGKNTVTFKKLVDEFKERC
jgi:DNA-binding XRE family transcriptional regulator